MSETAVLEAELNCLGIMLMHPEAAQRLAADIRPADFYLPSHGLLFGAAQEIIVAGGSVDPVILADRLRDQPWFDEVGGAGYLHTLASLPGLVAHAGEYARIVRENAIERETVKIGEALSARKLSANEAIERLRELATGSSLGPPFITALELARETPEELEPVVDGYLYRGSTAELDGRIKDGKTTVALDFGAGVVTGEQSLGRSTTKSAVLYLTEQNRPSFMVALERAQLSGCPDLHILFRHEYRGEWPAVAAGARRRALEVGAGLVIVDTLHAWANMGKDDENDAGAALAAMRPIQEIAAAGPAVLVLRHARKGGGDIGESARGSSAFGGAVDTLLSLRRMTSPGHENRRELIAVSRFDGVPPKVVIELEGGKYHLLGEGDELERQEARRRVLDRLPARPEDARTFEAILEDCGEGTTRTTLHRALTELVRDGQAEREKGAGEAGPRGYGYWRGEGAE